MKLKALAINALLFVPKDNSEKFGMSRLEASVSLYCRKVLIDAKPKDLLPEWLRFMKGVIDSEDLPLNISRETMQDRSLIEKLNKVVTKRFLKFLSEEAEARPDAFNEFYSEFGIFLKEGAAMDYTHKEQLTKLLRFESSLTDKGKTTSLADYVTRMGAEQKEIYYLVGPNRAALETGPYLEGFKARNLEVVFCYEAVDEYVMSNVREFDGKKLTAADHADVKLSDLPKPEGALSEDDTKKLTAWLKETLGARVEEVKASDRLVDSPALAVNADKFMSPQMRRMMKAMKKDAGIHYWGNAHTITGAIGLLDRVAALAFGLFGLPAADILVGPGNQYVAEAKRLLYGRIGIDMVAGPTDSMVIADASADPAIVVTHQKATASASPQREDLKPSGECRSKQKARSFASSSASRGRSGKSSVVVWHMLRRL